MQHGSLNGIISFAQFLLILSSKSLYAGFILKSFWASKLFLNLTVRYLLVIGKLRQSWGLITLFLSPSYPGESFSLLTSQVSGLDSPFPLTPSSHAASWLLLSSLSGNCSVWSEMAYFLLVVFSGLRLFLTSLLCWTLLITFSYWNIFLFHHADRMLPCFSYLLGCSFCHLSWLSFLLCVHDLGHPPGSNLSWMLSH